SRVAVQQLNAQVVQTIVTDLQEEVKSRPDLDRALQASANSPAGAGGGSPTQEIIDARGRITTIDPAVVARPFGSRTANILRAPVTVNDFL
ncbi:hypothetical protein NL533_31525, partial [Klebsiella pneumoniae]|nr:hypothetical protein [Klebsiella pneumoniae]